MPRNLIIVVVPRVFKDDVLGIGIHGSDRVVPALEVEIKPNTIRNEQALLLKQSFDAHVADVHSFSSGKEWHARGV